MSGEPAEPEGDIAWYQAELDACRAELARQRSALTPEFWETIRELVSDAERTWEHDDSRMKWCGVHLYKDDLRMLKAAVEQGGRR